MWKDLRNYGLGAALAGVVALGASETHAATDYVISSFIIGSPITTNIDGTKSVPIRVVVKNIGTTGTARSSKLHAEFTGCVGPFCILGPFVVAFRPFSSGQFTWYPVIPGLLAGGTRTVDGWLIFGSGTAGTVTVRVKADSCAGDEFVTDPPCKITESNEGNNFSVWRTITLP